MDNWISVKDQLPKRGDRVLVYRPTAFQTGHPDITLSFYGLDGREDIYGFNCYVQPTHWMPIPELPA